MKKVLYLLLILIVFSVPAFADPFCDGWKAGYIEGYCYGNTYCIEPYPPYCPYPRIGENTYIDGYNRGFLKGLRARR